jgi:hypothetical protein
MVILLGGGPSWADIVTAVGTALLALFAIATTGFAAAAFGAQSSQLRSEQGERLREAEERRRAQAVQVYVWQTPPTTPCKEAGGRRRAARHPSSIAASSRSIT